MVGWLQPDGIHIDLAFRYTLEHLRAPKTPWNIPLKMPPYIPKDESDIKGHQQTLSDTPEEYLRSVWRLPWSVWRCLAVSVEFDACMCLVLALGVQRSVSDNLGNF